MSALNNTNTSLQSELITISDEILIYTYGEVALSILTMLTNIANFVYIQYKFASSLVYQIQKIDSLVTSVCQIGYIGILLSSISDNPNFYICNIASALISMSGFHFILSNLFMVTGR